MSDGEVFAWFIFGGFGLLCFVCMVVIEVRKGPRKRNRRLIHMPRETLWGRTRRYHGETD